MSYHAPHTLSDALDLMSSGAGVIVAGGTDLYPAARPGQAPDLYVDITRVEGLRRIAVTASDIHIGAGVTWTDILREDLPPAFDALKEAAREVGSVQIQNAATLVGNLCNASPAADGVPALLALDASVEIWSAQRGRRIVPLAAFVRGVRETDLAKDEIVSGVIVPAPASDMRAAFEKLGSRRFLVISICMVAVNAALDAEGRLRDPRIAVGACSAVAQRMTALEQALTGQAPDTLRITPDQLTALSPIDDVRGSAAYRLDVVCTLIERAIQRAVTA